MRSPRRGQIYRLKADDAGKPRPVLIVSRSSLNGGIYVLTVPFLGTNVDEKLKRFPQCCVLFEAGEFGLTKRCVAKADDVTQYRLTDIRISDGSVGELDEEALAKINEALVYCLDLG